MNTTSIPNANTYISPVEVVDVVGESSVIFYNYKQENVFNWPYCHNFLEHPTEYMHVQD